MADTAPLDLDLRLVRYFTAVAEHRHFGRAATELRVAQPSLSRQVSRLEQQLGVRLLDRTPQGTKLTEAGEVFLPKAKALLRSADQAAAHARAAAQPSHLTVGYSMGLIVTPAVLQMRQKHPDAEVRATHLKWDEARTALLDHRVDAVVARLPFPTDQLHVTILYDEPRVVLLPSDHPLAQRDSLILADIANEPMPRIRDADPSWSAYWRVEPRPDGSLAPDGPVIDALEDKFEVIASGQAISLSAGAHGNTIRPDIVAIPLDGVEPSHVVLATRADDRGRLVAAFRKIAQAVLTGPD